LTANVPGLGALTIRELATLTGRSDTVLRKRIRRGADPLDPGDQRFGNHGGSRAGRPAGFLPATCRGGGTMFIAMRLVLLFGDRRPDKAQLQRALPGMSASNLCRWRRVLLGKDEPTPHHLGMRGCVDLARRFASCIPERAGWEGFAQEVGCSRASAYRLIVAMRDAAGLP
jgi:hypothetical protein